MGDDSSSRIVRSLDEWIRRAPPGARLPSTRALVAEFGASPVTVQKALRTLAARDLIETRPGSGVFTRGVRAIRPVDFGWQTAALRSPLTRPVAPPAALRPTPPGHIALHAGYPARELLPERLVRAALGRAARSDAAISRSPEAGDHELRSWFARELGAASPSGVIPPSASDVAIVPGSQSGLGSIFRGLAVAGRPVLLESPTYWGAMLAANQAGVAVVPVPSGTSGPDPDELDRAFRETGARLFYAQPNYANPTGAQWAPDLAERIVEVVRAHDAFLVEDDWAHDFGIDSDARPLAARDDTGHVIYLRSLTKSVSPSLRIAAVVARGPARHRVLADRRADSLYVSGVLQTAALEVVTHPGWQAHLRSIRPQLRARRDQLVTALREHAPLAQVTHVPRGGLNLWVRLPDGVDLDRLVAECELRGVLVAPGDEWFPAEPEAPFIRLNYAGPDPQTFTDGARILGERLAAIYST